MRRLFVLIALFLAGLAPAQAQDFPALSGRVVDQAGLLTPEQEAALTSKLAALEQSTSRQLVVATIASLQDRPIEDYGVALGRHWRIGQSEANNGALLIVAPNEKRVRIEVGYGLEGILTDALSSDIVRNQMTPHFRENDYAGGIDAGVDAIIAQLQAPPELAEQRAQEAAAQGRERGQGWVMPLIFWGIIVLAILLPAFFGRRGRGQRYRGDGGLTQVILWGLANSIAQGGRGGGGSWGGGGGFGGGGGGGFSGGGGSFGGGGASGSW